MAKLLPGLLFLILILSCFDTAGAVLTLAQTSIEQYSPTGYRGGISSHVGEICIACHARFSKNQPYADEVPYNVSNNAVLHIFPCSKPACHKTPPTKFRPKGTSRWTLHLRICENCHPRWNTSARTIHNTHLNFDYLQINKSGVSCDLCHSQPKGYNSSIVRVPPWPSDFSKLTGAIVKLQWKGDCSFCHFTIIGASRVHDVHDPVLLDACPVCHSTHILKSENMFTRIGLSYPFKKETSPTLEDKITSVVVTNQSITRPEKTPLPGFEQPVPLLSEFYLYFDGILEGLLEIYELVV